LKERFTKKLVLVAPDLDKKMRMEVNVSDYAIRGVLFMECKNGKWQPVALLSKSLNEIEKNYEIHDKEMLVVISIKLIKFGPKFFSCSLLFYFSFLLYSILGTGVRV